MFRVYTLEPLLPWDVVPEDSQRAKKITVAVLLFCLILSVIISVLPKPEVKREQAESLPPRLAKLVMKQKAKPKPPPPKVEKKKEEKKEEKKKEEKKKEEKPKEEKKKEKPKLTEQKQKAREVAKKHVAVFDSLSDLRDMSAMSTLTAKPLQKGQGSQAKTTERSLITSSATKSSGGIAVAKASSGGGGGGTLEGVTTTQVESSLAEVQEAEAKKEAQIAKKGTARRATEDIQLVFDRYKGAIYSIYRRALRKNPGLEGTVVLHLVIEPTGEVSTCEVVSSELEDPALEAKIVARVKLINFGSDRVERWDDTYPISFIPS